MGTIPPEVPNVRLWRYMSFGRFVWALRHKSLWLSRLDLLGDPWEAMPTTSQILQVMQKPLAELRNGTCPFPDAREALLSNLRYWSSVRRCLYVNCWTRNEHESHAMWRIYCHSIEGVAVETTLRKLSDSLRPEAWVLPVSYDANAPTEQRPDIYGIATLKRPVFSYENEMRVIVYDEENIRNANNNPAGKAVAWNMAACLESIRTHPESDESFKSALAETIRAFEPGLMNIVRGSDMSAEPLSPFIDAAKQLGIN